MTRRIGRGDTSRWDFSQSVSWRRKAEVEIALLGHRKLKPISLERKPPGSKDNLQQRVLERLSFWKEWGKSWKQGDWFGVWFWNIWIPEVSSHMDVCSLATVFNIPCVARGWFFWEDKTKASGFREGTEEDTEGWGWEAARKSTGSTVVAWDHFPHFCSKYLLTSHVSQDYTFGKILTRKTEWPKKKQRLEILRW